MKLTPFKIDDIVVCIPGFEQKDDDDGKSGGFGYKKGLVAKVDRTWYTATNEQICFGNFEGLNGVYSRALRLATEKEIDDYNKGIRFVFDKRRYLIT